GLPQPRDFGWQWSRTIGCHDGNADGVLRSCCTPEPSVFISMSLAGALAPLANRILVPSGDQMGPSESPWSSLKIVRTLPSALTRMIVPGPLPWLKTSARPSGDQSGAFANSKSLAQHSCNSPLPSELAVNRYGRSNGCRAYASLLPSGDQATDLIAPAGNGISVSPVPSGLMLNAEYLPTVGSYRV